VVSLLPIRRARGKKDPRKNHPGVQGVRRNVVSFLPEETYISDIFLSEVEVR
jgi:hypothetical protein